MANLKDLLSKRNQDGQSPASDASHQDSAAGTPTVSEDSTRTEPVPAETAAEAPANQRPAGRFGVRKGAGSSDSTRPVGDGPAPSSPVDSGGEQPKPRLSGLRFGAGTQSASDDTGSVDAPALDSLDALDASESAGVAPRDAKSSVLSQFDDETPATKPTRELPEGLTKEQLGFVDMVDGVYEVLHEPELLGGVIRNIMIELKNNPEYMKLVANEDIRTWVKGMRESMGLAKIKKMESKAKRSGGAGRKSKLVDDDMLNDLNDLGIEIPT